MRRGPARHPRRMRMATYRRDTVPSAGALGHNLPFMKMPFPVSPCLPPTLATLFRSANRLDTLRLT
jgi:hypothetical protein